MAVEPLSRTQELEEFYQEISTKGLDALWRHTPAEPTAKGARPAFAPYVWRWDDVRPRLNRACELVRPGPDAERRVLTLNNPSVKPIPWTTNTISAAIQMVLPGEVAPAHRHTMAAIRFILEGKGAQTLVNGEPCTMQPGDFILTPAWCWHGHINESDGPMVWMDSLDVPLVRTLRLALYEDYPGELQPAELPPDSSISRYGGGQMRPVWERWANPVSPLLSYPWTASERALKHLARLGEASPYDDVAFEYTNPSTGGHALPTIGCWIQMFRPGVHTKAHRRNTVSVYQVFRGRGSTIVDGVQIDWQKGDFFTVPSNAWREHINGSVSDDAVLFSTNDLPLLESINLYREEAYEENGGYQEVVAKYAEPSGNGAH
jgi:gentisate 1,2-dioxygenase